MTRDVALRRARANLDMIVHYMKNNLPDDEYRENRLHVGRSMAELIEISNKIHKQYPDTIPDELK